MLHRHHKIAGLRHEHVSAPSSPSRINRLSTMDLRYMRGTDRLPGAVSATICMILLIEGLEAV